MYGDPEVMRRRVDQLREQAIDIRALADQLVARTEGTGWSGRAADAMRVRVGERATHLHDSAAQHDAAADSLDKHLVEVEAQQEAIAGVERRVRDLVAEAVTRVARVEQANLGHDGAVRRDPHPDDTTLCAFTPPPPGHRDWLAVELPGL